MLIIFKYANYFTMNAITTLILLSLPSLLAQVDPYTEIGNTISGSLIIYNNSTALAQGPPAVQFTVIYSSPRQSNAKLALSMSGFEQRDNMANSYFKLSLGADTLTSFSVHLLSAGSSQVFLTKIMYIAIQDLNNAFYCLWIEFPTFSNISSGNGVRTDNKFSSFYSITGGAILNADLALNRAFVFLTGFHIQAVSGNFGLEIGVTLTNQISFTTTIKANFDCRIQYVQGLFIFIDTSKFSNPGLYTYSDIFTLDSTSSTSYVPNYATSYGHRIFGLFHLKGVGTRNAGAIINFDLSIDNNYIASVSVLVIQKIQFYYIFMGLKQCKSTYPYYTNSSKTKCSSQCQSSMTQSPTSYICETCTSPCSQCISTKINCTACITNYELSNGACLKQPEQTLIISDSKLYLLGLLGLIPITIVPSCVLVQEGVQGCQIGQSGANGSTCYRYDMIPQALRKGTKFFNHFIFNIDQYGYICIFYQYYEYLSMNIFIRSLVSCRCCLLAFRNFDNVAHFNNYRLRKNSCWDKISRFLVRGGQTTTWLHSTPLLQVPSRSQSPISLSKYHNQISYCFIDPPSHVQDHMKDKTNCANFLLS